MAYLDETQAKANQVVEEEEETWSSAMQLAMSIVLPMAMKTAIELDIFEIIAKAGDGAKLSAPDIAAHLPTKNPDAPVMLDRILRLLASHCVLGCSFLDGERLYSLAPVSKYFVSNQDGVSLRPFMSLILDKVCFDSWFELKNTILEGGLPFRKAHGKQLFEYVETDPRFNEIFNGAMLNHTTIAMKKIVNFYKGFEQTTQLVDVGGGYGVTLNIITSKYPRIKAINFDLPQVIQSAPSYPGVEHIGGDMFERIPKGDTVLLKWILHNWDDDHCLRLLKNCYEAIPADGKVVVMDTVIPVVPEIITAARENSLMDAIMLVQLPGGKERTKTEYVDLATGAGFKCVNFECVVCNYCIMEFFK